MIYLIGGPPKCGKTTLTKLLSKRLSVPWISADTLQNIVRAYIPENKHSEVFPHSAVRGVSNDIYYSQNSTDEIVSRYMKQGEATNDALKMIAASYIADEDNFIVEGYQVHPKIVSEIIDTYGGEHVRSIFIIRTDIEKYVKDIPKSTTPNDWIVRKTKDPETFKKIARMVALYSNQIEYDAKKNKLPVINMDDEFETNIEKAIELLTAQ
ncbi:hypothetical protein KKF03_00230 [Patescibacteria group bacterium]|nr:hypothetical protein [Patescibacteria group bacterium]MBU1910787.1 hypothetical protein [Patescibacteria group bacterium]